MKISYVCLIYKSVRYLKFVYEEFHKYTKLNEDDEFYFVANDACEEVLNYLVQNNIKHYIHNNSEEQRKEWYINNVYRAWNKAAKMAKGDYIIFLNSDFGFSDNWSTNLQKYIDDNKCICSRLVERGPLDGGMPSGRYGIEKSFGNTTNNYRSEEFNEYVKIIQEDKLYPGGLYMPLLIKKSHLELVNFYPEGNIISGSNIFNPTIITKEQSQMGIPLIPGDIVLMEKLRLHGIEHYTCFNSIIYHFQEGEMRE
jgi:hypothetical protein